MPWWTSFAQRLRQHWQQQRAPKPIPPALWHSTVQAYPFLAQLPEAQTQHLQNLSAHFLQHKEFTGAQGLQVTDAMAVAIAAQACVLLLHWGDARESLRWYDDFVGIVVYPHDVKARRQFVDPTGVVHSYDEELMGEAMHSGPIMLSWAAVQPGHPDLAGHGNVVIHEFAHKLDLRDGHANGCPPLPPGFMGAQSAAQARQRWSSTWSTAFARFQDAVALHERFDQPAPYLDPYAAEDPGEFFAVACEAWVVDHAGLEQAMPDICAMLDAFFNRPSQP